MDVTLIECQVKQKELLVASEVEERHGSFDRAAEAEIAGSIICGLRPNNNRAESKSSIINAGTTHQAITDEYGRYEPTIQELPTRPPSDV
ncbi:hypothetical protein AC579_10031 [Pseudocercospora musae]|uniref:Uncharacterized protein n=1 Tax=Pseudocercospora musae TaxID=113226 RepID=A0A139IHG1_9PEZI|nr:hypothetical protein AC579_10031 [Pseudocercospora musae]